MKRAIHAFGKSRRVGVMLLPFPLTPALCLRERENLIVPLDEPRRGRFAKPRATLLPLPNPDQSGLRSEGWGEGEARTRRESLPRDWNALGTRAT